MSVWRKEGEKRTSKSNKQTTKKLDKSFLQPLHTGGEGRDEGGERERHTQRDTKKK